jgi:hypothetical protein
MIYNSVPRRLALEINVAVKCGNIRLSSVDCYAYIQRVVTCTQDAQYIAGVGCDRMIME